VKSYFCDEFLVLQQEALQKLGFYSGEEDMEFSSFSSGTERAVKTWQVSLCFQ
jgi:peptidoglycan hydrolase-like protein with peptidoglycan-binding domain